MEGIIAGIFQKKTRWRAQASACARGFEIGNLKGCIDDGDRAASILAGASRAPGLGRDQGSTCRRRTRARPRPSPTRPDAEAGQAARAGAGSRF